MKEFFLDSVAETYKTKDSQMSKWSIDSYIDIYKKFINIEKSKGLELGCSSGYSTICLSKLCHELDVVDGSQKMLQQLYKSVGDKANVKYIYSLFDAKQIYKD